MTDGVWKPDDVIGGAAWGADEEVAREESDICVEKGEELV